MVYSVCRARIDLMGRTVLWKDWIELGLGSLSWPYPCTWPGTQLSAASLILNVAKLRLNYTIINVILVASFAL